MAMKGHFAFPKERLVFECKLATNVAVGNLATDWVKPYNRCKNQLKWTYRYLKTWCIYIYIYIYIYELRERVRERERERERERLIQGYR